jgi:hypothetical protein
VAAVRDIDTKNPELLVDRNRESMAHRNNGVEPEQHLTHPLGAAAMWDFGDDSEHEKYHNRYVEYLNEFQPKSLVTAEPEGSIKQDPSYARYKEWSSKGIEPPYISVSENDDGQMVASNRRRTLVAQELGKPIKGWLSPINAETKLPLKYGDVTRALAEARGQRHDAMDYTDELKNLMELVRTTFYGIEPPERLQQQIDALAKSTSKFQKGQLSKVLSDVLGVNVFFDDKNLLAKMKGFVSQNVDLITSIDEQYFTGIQQGLMTQIRKGDRVETIRDWLLDDERYDITKARASLIARDQVGKFYGELNHERQTEIGVEQYIWTTVGDERVRGTPGGRWPNGMHYELDGTTQTWGDPPVTNDDGDRNEPGGDYQCLPGLVKITVPAFAEVLYRRYFSGPLTTFITESGKGFAVTGNHPVATQRGWVAAALVKESDYLLQAVKHNVSMNPSYINDGGACIEQVYDLFALLGVMERYSGITAQFHGDGSKHDVDIITLESNLLADIQTPFTQAVENFILANTDKPEWLVKHAALCYFPTMIQSMLLSFDRRMRGFGQFTALLYSQASHTNIIGLTTVSDFKAFILQKSADGCSGYSKAFGESQRAKSIFVEPDKIWRCFKFVVSRTMQSLCGIYTPLTKVDTEVIRVNAEALPNLHQSEFFTMQRDRVIQKGISEFSGHVYNLQTEDGWYFAETCALQNCRCTATPILPKI